MDPRRTPGLAGILQWSLAQGGDGTGPPPASTEADRAWLASAVQSLTVDEGARMRDLGACLRETVAHPVAPGEGGDGGGGGGAPAPAATPALASAAASRAASAS